MGYFSTIEEFEGFYVGSVSNETIAEINEALRLNAMDFFINFEIESARFVETGREGKLYNFKEEFKDFLSDLPDKVRENLNGSFLVVGESYGDIVRYVVDDGELTVSVGRIVFD